MLKIIEGMLKTIIEELKRLEQRIAKLELLMAEQTLDELDAIDKQERYKIEQWDSL